MSGDTSYPRGRSSPDRVRPNMSALRIVLVGKTGAGKSSSGNTIMGRDVFSGATRECWKEVGEVAGREMVVVDTHGLFDTTCSELAVKQEISKCINMTAPGPHAIVLVIRVGTFTAEEEQSVEKVRAIFGEKADRYTNVLFTRGDELTCTIEEYLNEAPIELKRILKLCGGRYHLFDNTNITNRTQVIKFVEKVDKMVAANRDAFYTSSMYQDVEEMLKEKEEEIRQIYSRELEEKERQFDEERRAYQETIEKLKQSGKDEEEKIKDQERLIQQNELKQMEYGQFYSEISRAAREEAENTHIIDAVPELYGRLQQIGPVSEPSSSPLQPSVLPERRLVLLGKYGVGKSAAGNTILGGQRFHSALSVRSVTCQSELKKSVVAGRQVSVVDTPGLFDTELSPEEVAAELGKSVYLSCKGVHAFLIVICVGRYTDQEKNVIQLITALYGVNVWNYAVILFTGGDELKGKTIEELIEGNKALSDLVRQCGGRYHVFNNKDTRNTDQVTALLEKIDRMVKENKGRCYTNEMLEEALRVSEKKMKMIDAERCKRKEEEQAERKHKKEQEINTEIEKVRKETEEKIRKEYEEERHRREEEVQALRRQAEMMRRERQQRLQICSLC